MVKKVKRICGKKRKGFLFGDKIHQKGSTTRKYIFLKYSYGNSCYVLDKNLGTWKTWDWRLRKRWIKK